MQNGNEYTTYSICVCSLDIQYLSTRVGKDIDLARCQSEFVHSQWAATLQQDIYPCDKNENIAINGK